MAHVEKYTRASIGHMAKHYERAKDANGEYVKFGNQNIDLARTAQNYNLAPVREMNQGEFIKQRCGEIRMQNRKDINVMASWVVTAPADLPESDRQTFFQTSYDFLAARYGGEKNVISAYVHMDEVSPHMHFAFVPTTANKKRGGEKLSAKEVLTRRDLQTFHMDLSRHLESVFGRDVGILNEATLEGNKSIAELKRGTAALKVADLTSKREAAAQEVAMLEKQRTALRSDVDTLRKEVKAEQQKADALSSQCMMLRHELLPLTESKKAVQDEIDALRGQIKTDTQKAARLNAQRATVHSEIVALVEAKNTAQGEIDVLGGQIKATTQETAALSTQKATLRSEVLLLMKGKDAAQSELDALKGQIKADTHKANMIMGRLNRVLERVRPETASDFKAHWDREKAIDQQKGRPSMRGDRGR